MGALLCEPGGWCNVSSGIPCPYDGLFLSGTSLGLQDADACVWVYVWMFGLTLDALGRPLYTPT